MSTRCHYCGRENLETATHCAECETDLRDGAGGREPLVDAEASDWILRTARWALDQFGGDYFYRETILVTPTREHFPEHFENPSDMAERVFRRVQEFAGLQNWPCKLIAQDPDIDPRLDPLTVIENPPQGPRGTFRVSVTELPEVEITYNPAAVERPQELVAVFAHELAHYLGHSASCPPPGGEKNWEYATDYLAVHMGFGIFLANSAVSFIQFTDVMSQGWSVGGLGYLSEFEVVYCLALFCTLKEIRREEIEPHLKSYLLEVYDNAIKDLAEKKHAVNALKAIGSVQKQADEP